MAKTASFGKPKPSVGMGTTIQVPMTMPNMKRLLMERNICYNDRIFPIQTTLMEHQTLKMHFRHHLLYILAIAVLIGTGVLTIQSAITAGELSDLSIAANLRR